MAVPPPAPAFADAVYAWLVQLDPAAFDADGISDARAALQDVHELAAALSDWYGSNPCKNGTEARTQSAFDGVVAALPQPGTVGSERLAWLTVREEVSPMYEAFALAVKSAGGRARHLHPTNYLRSFVHLMNGLVVVAAFQFVFTQTTAFWAATAFVVWAWSLEGARRVSPTVNAWCMKVFGPIARDHERYRINSATWYGTALWVLAITSFGPAGVLGLLCLAVGDPVAGLIGRTYGQIRIPGGKSLEGSLAFALVSTAVGYAYLLVFQWTMAPLPVLLSIAIIAGVCGALIELVSTRLEDNFTIPVFTSWLVGIAMWALT